MVRELFSRVLHYTRSPYADDLSAFARWMLQHGYSARYAQRQVFRVMRSLEASTRASGSAWTPEQLERAFRRIRHRPLYRHAQHAFSAFLKATGRLKESSSPRPHAVLVAEYERYLIEVRGLSRASVTMHLRDVGAFLRKLLPDGRPVARLTSAAIEEYIEHRGRRVARCTLSTTVLTLRAFLRYCFGRQLIPVALDCIDKPARFKDPLPARALDWPLIQRFLDSIDRGSLTGWRDFMLLHLMAHYGLRTGEITRLTLDSIDWSAGTLRIDQSKTHSWLTLPLMRETLKLLRHYLKEGRRTSSRRELFLSGRAPDRPMTKYSASLVFKQRARQSKLPIAHASAYALRHSFAMRLFSRGVGIKMLGDLMGHHSLVSTTVYLRLQTDMLREVALPVPTLSDVGGAP